MKKIVWQAGLVLSVTGALFTGGSLSGFKPVESGITGRINPVNGAESVWALSGKDSVKAAISAGAFALTVKPGTYKLIIDAKDPYKDVVLENLEVKTQTLDVGEIVLQ